MQKTKEIPNSTSISEIVERNITTPADDFTSKFNDKLRALGKKEGMDKKMMHRHVDGFGRVPAYVEDIDELTASTQDTRVMLEIYSTMFTNSIDEILENLSHKLESEEVPKLVSDKVFNKLESDIEYFSIEFRKKAEETVKLVNSADTTNELFGLLRIACYDKTGMYYELNEKLKKVKEFIYVADIYDYPEKDFTGK